MGVRLGVLLLAVAGCATAPVRDDNLERINSGMAPEKTELPAGLPMGEAPPLALPDSPGLSGPTMPGYVRHGRAYRHLTPTESDYYTGNVSVPAVTTGSPPPNVPMAPPMPVVPPPAQ